MSNNPKIFLVDDNLFSLNLYHKSLETAGYTDVSLFTNGSLCLNNLHQKPDIIFLDHNMDDDLNGFEVLKKIKRVDPDIYVIIVSAQESMGTAIDSLKYGAFDYIIKNEQEIKRMTSVLQRISAIKEAIKQQNPTFIQRVLSIF